MRIRLLNGLSGCQRLLVVAALTEVRVPHSDASSRRNGVYCRASTNIDFSKLITISIPWLRQNAININDNQFLYIEMKNDAYSIQFILNCTVVSRTH